MGRDLMREVQMMEKFGVISGDVSRPPAPGAVFGFKDKLVRMERRDQLAKVVLVLHRVCTPRKAAGAIASCCHITRRAMAAAGTMPHVAVGPARTLAVRVILRRLGHWLAYHLRQSRLRRQG